jgi:hypothetical protein
MKSSIGPKNLVLDYRFLDFIDKYHVARELGDLDGAL